MVRGFGAETASLTIGSKLINPPRFDHVETGERGLRFHLAARLLVIVEQQVVAFEKVVVSAEISKLSLPANHSFRAGGGVKHGRRDSSELSVQRLVDRVVDCNDQIGAAIVSMSKPVVALARGVGSVPWMLESAHTPMPSSVDPFQTGTRTGVSPSESRTSASPIPTAAIRLGACCTVVDPNS